MRNLQDIATFSTSFVQNESYRVDTYKTLLTSMQYVFGSGVPGDIVEFGTMTARTAVCLASALRCLNSVYAQDVRGNKRVYFFDSFSGLPESAEDADVTNPHVRQGIWGPGTCKGLTEVEFEELIAKLLPSTEFEVRAGYFNDSVPTLDKSQKFSLVHVDVDLYQSTIDCLDSLFAQHLISEGAHLLFDDFYCAASNASFGEMAAWKILCDRYSISARDMGSYQTTGQRFLIERY